MNDSAGPSTTTWRRTPVTTFPLAIMGISLTFTGLSRLPDWTESGLGGEGVFFILLIALWVVLVAMGILDAVRTRVSLVDSALEVRQRKTVLYPYSQIADVRIDRASNDRTIRLTLADGDRITLPAPVRHWRRSPDPKLVEAVAAIRERAGLPLAPPLLP